MKTIHPRLALATATAVFGITSLAHAQRFDYHPRLVTGAADLDWSVRTFYADYQTYLKVTRRWPASRTYRTLQDELLLTSKLTGKISEQLRLGATPCQIEANAKALSASMGKVDGILRMVSLTPRLQSTWGQARTHYAAVDSGFGRALLAYSERMHPRGTRPGSGGGFGQGSYGTPVSGGYGRPAETPHCNAAPQAVRPYGNSPVAVHPREDMMAQIYDRIFGRELR